MWTKSVTTTTVIFETMPVSPVACLEQNPKPFICPILKATGHGLVFCSHDHHHSVKQPWRGDKYPTIFTTVISSWDSLQTSFITIIIIIIPVMTYVHGVTCLEGNSNALISCWLRRNSHKRCHARSFCYSLREGFRNATEIIRTRTLFQGRCYNYFWITVIGRSRNCSSNVSQQSGLSVISRHASPVFTSFPSQKK